MTCDPNATSLFLVVDSLFLCFSTTFVIRRRGHDPSLANVASFLQEYKLLVIGLTRVDARQGSCDETSIMANIEVCEGARRGLVVILDADGRAAERLSSAELYLSVLIQPPETHEQGKPGTNTVVTELWMLEEI
ncbi:hypothetical protein AUEXF2481DRAFT_3301 [Aureobasidium subglaciale EXF-2481]|uniref:Uncharacterized protein n=1 Tax=Aureobasidium subglaciale (strain EXF-2481) TaxID=1043005 RepID=A0A074YIG2_AURSE|nr:uncharacterized protein AUEXF2481DRAFT_3301 [Aureobasidium subglaciale EXF-2481]KEQ97495.1 hypothetical protein AUEXF2481DRAFT_3301 [Aureobasidium subglaciale EXF-2481]